MKLVVTVPTQAKQEPQLLHTDLTYTQAHTLNIAEHNTQMQHQVKWTAHDQHIQSYGL